MTRWMVRPAGLRQLIQDCVIKDRLLPTEQGPQSLADLAVLNKEWQQEVEKFTFKTLRLDVCEGIGGQTELSTRENGLFYDTPRAVGTSNEQQTHGTPEEAHFSICLPSPWHWG